MVEKKERRVGKEPALILWFTKDWKGEQSKRSEGNLGQGVVKALSWSPSYSFFGGFIMFLPR